MAIKDEGRAAIRTLLELKVSQWNAERDLERALGKDIDDIDQQIEAAVVGIGEPSDINDQMVEEILDEFIGEVQVEGKS